MNENFENNFNENETVEMPEPQPAIESETKEEPIAVEPEKREAPITQGYAQPPYANYGNTNQYMPYGSYAPYNRPEAEKKPSKGKKKGVIIAFLLLGVSFIIAVAVFFASIFMGQFNNGTSTNDGDKTQMDFAETPNKTETIDDGNEMSANAIYKKVHESSVGVIVYSGNRQQVSAEGTGVVLGVNDDNTGSYIITCAHVVDVANAKIIVQTSDGTQYDAILVGMDSKTDIGVIYVAETSLKAAEFANSETLEVGDTVYAIGNPGGTQFFGSFTNGIVSAIGRPVDSPVGYEVACVQHTAAINPGNSGGALVNAYGQVIGINSSKIASTDFEGMGFAVPSSTVKEIVDQLIKDGRVTNRPALGITFMPSTQSQMHAIIVKTNKLPAGSIVIDTIMIGSDLQNKNVQEGDMIIGVNGKNLDDYNMILEIIENGKVGDTLTLKICRINADYEISIFDVEVKLVEDSSLSEPVKETETQTFPFPFGN